MIGYLAIESELPCPHRGEGLEVVAIQSGGGTCQKNAARVRIMECNHPTLPPANCSPRRYNYGQPERICSECLERPKTTAGNGQPKAL